MKTPLHYSEQPWSLSSFSSSSSLRQLAPRLIAALLLLILVPAASAQQVHRLPLRPTPTNALARLPIPTSSPEATSPVQVFRDLLEMTSEQRQDYLNSHLANRPDDIKRIQAKVLEYGSLNLDQRELRLRVTELRWYLWPALKASPTNRAAWLSRIPTKNEERKLIEDRLQHWDKLSPEVQKQLLANEATLRYFTELAAGTDEERSNIVKNLSPERRKKLEAGIRQIQQMPEVDRQKMLARFNQFFELSPTERDRTLGVLSDSQRQQLEKALRTFSGLAPELREQCVRSFERFLNLSLAERQQFLKNAERWKLMSPQERQDWIQLVDTMTIMPPFPPGMAPGASQP